MKAGVRAIALVLVFSAAAAIASAQEAADPGDRARFQWGALRFTPAIAVSDIGVDNNVFNDPDHQVSDTTSAFGPAVNLWLNAGPLRISGKGSGQYLYFKKYENQRSWNTDNEMKLQLPLSRFKPFAIGSYVNTRQRPGFEIDARARASTALATLGTELRLSGKTGVILSGSRTTTAFDDQETFLGSELAKALNRHSDSELLQLRYELTPLTTLVVNAEAMQDRFEHDDLRNADSISVRPGFEFKPLALISGRVSVGIRHFNALDASVRDYQGLIAAVDAKFTVTTSTQVGVTVSRDLAFSYDELSPYYTLTNSAVMITQRISTSWDVVGRGAEQTLAYQGLVTRIPGDGPRTDRVGLLGLGVGYRIGQGVRVGFDSNYYVRRSQVGQRNYDGFRAGASVSYGISQ